MNEIRKNLYTQKAYADKIKVSRQRVHKMVKDGLLKIVEVNGTILIKSD